jgi:hypothetical protein
MTRTMSMAQALFAAAGNGLAVEICGSVGGEGQHHCFAMHHPAALQ